MSERTKREPTGFDLVCATPVTGAGLQSLVAYEELLQLRAEIDPLLRARGIVTDWLFIKEDGKQWNNAHMWKIYIKPILGLLVARKHPGMAGVDLSDSRRTNLYMYRRGGAKFHLLPNNGLNPDLVDFMGRWRVKLANREPAIMRQRYNFTNSMSCEDGYAVTTAAPPRSSLGFAAWYPFERVPIEMKFKVQ